jgi:hypothetical protein
MSIIEANTLKPISGSSTLTLGESGDTVTLASGASSSGFGAALTGSTDNTVVTVTGANAMQGEANLTFDGTQLVLTDSNEGTDNLLVKTTSDNSISMALEKSDFKFDIGLDHNNDGSKNFYIRERSEDGSTTNAVRMEIDNDGIVKVNSKLVIDNSVVAAFKLNIEAGGNNESGIVINDKDAASNFPFLSMRRSGTVIGSIERNGSNDAVSYQTSSDYRLKQSEENITDGITRIKQLKPYKFNWKSNPSGDKVDGFFAHEVQTVVPEAISGEKDGAEMQGIDQSKLVPLLTAALKEAITKIETLEAKVAALESA